MAENPAIETDSAGLRHRIRWVIAAASFGFVVVQLDVTIVNVALPPIGFSLAATTTLLQWVVDGYTLSFAVLLLSAGVLADRIGSRRAYLLGFAVFALSSAACGLALNGFWLIAARVLQGVGAALLVPSSLSVLSAACGTDHATRARAVGAWTAAGGVSIAAAPILGGLLLQVMSWRSLFFVNLPLCAVGAWLTLRYAPDVKPQRAARAFDPGGQLMSIVALSGLITAIIEARSWTEGRTVIIVAAVFAIVGAVGFQRIESRVKEPMLPLEFFRRPAFGACVVFGVLVNLCYYGMLFVLSLYLQSAHGYSPLRTGMAYLPLTAIFIVSNLVSGPLTARLGARIPMAGGAAVEAAGFALLTELDAQSGYWAMLPAFVMIPLGMGTAVPAMTTTILGSVEQRWSGTVSGALNAARQAGGAMGVAVFGALVAGDSARIVRGLHAAGWLSVGLLAVAAVAAWQKVPSGAAPSRALGHRERS